MTEMTNIRDERVIENLTFSNRLDNWQYIGICLRCSYLCERT